MTQHLFAAALLDPNRAAPSDIRTWNGSDPVRRFAVYRNNVIASLIEALADTFPVCRQLVGDDFFRAMALEFVRASPPSSPRMSDYGEEFPSFIERFTPAASVAYLADVARLERLRVDAYHAADNEPLDVTAAADCLADTAQLPLLRARLHPSAGLLRSRFAAVSIWAAHQGRGTMKSLKIDQPQQALVIRPSLDVEVVPLDLASWTFATALNRHETLGAALESTRQTHADFDVAQSLGLLLRAGLIIALQPGMEPS
ncbi:DUF2063 domain-containing protein [Marinobacterium nitratireducens]|uniref:DUF2063 domain-containing protein n=1 Tax=Marinobacterium nitratireducens TaxID=518897 RepID=A0A917Z7E3_9GAMM|nr:DNA-binding domain-containing protein [Marinobacterium nitratireducens]GGO77144.1 DUF2063 domain-containing protein [Marinobacterium nitratireducens]